jgi:hypothetical protein
MSQTPSGYFPGAMYFYPGQTWNSTNTQPHNTYGEWQVKYIWTTQAWANNQDGLDWGLMELWPNASGQYPGDIVGNFQAFERINYVVGAHVYPVGYPASGIFRSAANHYGWGQYFCNTSWNGDTVQDFGNIMYAHQCAYMTGGASGGPVFVELADGRWVIGGVNNKGWPDAINPQYAKSAYFFQDSIGALWRSIFG